MYIWRHFLWWFDQVQIQMTVQMNAHAQRNIMCDMSQIKSNFWANRRPKKRFFWPRSSWLPMHRSKSTGPYMHKKAQMTAQPNAHTLHIIRDTFDNIHKHIWYTCYITNTFFRSIFCNGRMLNTTQKQTQTLTVRQENRKKTLQTFVSALSMS